MEVDVIVSPDLVFFFRPPPEELLKLLRELGLDFEEEVTWCG